MTTLKPDPIFDVYEGESPVAWSEMNPRPILAILKASGKFYDGVRREDYQVENYAAQCRALNIPIGLYHFLLPNNITEQANLFLSVWNKLGADCPPIVDVECYPDMWGVGNVAWANQIKAFLDLVEFGTNQRPMIYTSRNFWGYTLDINGNAPAWTNDYPLWAAWYPDQPDNFDAPPASVWPKGWTHWEMWQYNDDGRSNGLLANDLNIASDAFKQTLGIVPEAYVIKRPLSEVAVCFTPGMGDPELGLPLLSAVEHAQVNGWDCAMNGGAGFDYTDATHAIPKSSGFQSVNGIPYANRLIDRGLINSTLDTFYIAPWSILGFDNSNVYLVVTRGLEGQYGMTKAQAARWCQTQGMTDAYLMDSGHSSQIERGGTMLYWPYGPSEKVPQCIGLKEKTGAIMTTKGVVKAGLKANVKRMDNSVIVAQMLAGDSVYGDSSTTGSDIINFTHFYRAAGDKFELPANCKVSVTNLDVYPNTPEPGTTPPPPPPPGDWVLKSWQFIVTDENGIDHIFNG